MKVITCTGFYGTGSSAVTDILMDCKNVSCSGDYEVRILHDPDGISDLQFNLIDNPNRHNTSNAIKRYKKIVDFHSSWLSGKTCDKYFHGEYKKISYEYIDRICEFSYLSKWHGDLLLRGSLFSCTSRAYNKIINFIKSIIKNSDYTNHDLLPKNEMAYAGIMDREVFLKETRLYMNELLKIVNTGQNDTLMVDQLVPPTNISRYLKYVEGLKVVVVDRDPRDIYLLEKYEWKGTVVPYYDVKLFCKWFKWTRQQARKTNNSDADKESILYIQFEDLIYHAEETVNKILNFANVDAEFYERKHFDPAQSIKNTRVWERYPQEMDNISYIEENLSEFIYNE